MSTRRHNAEGMREQQLRELRQLEIIPGKYYRPRRRKLLSIEEQEKIIEAVRRPLALLLYRLENHSALTGLLAVARVPRLSAPHVHWCRWHQACSRVYKVLD